MMCAYLLEFQKQYKKSRDCDWVVVNDNGNALHHEGSPSMGTSKFINGGIKYATIFKPEDNGSIDLFCMLFEVDQSCIVNARKYFSCMIRLVEQISKGDA